MKSPIYASIDFKLTCKDKPMIKKMITALICLGLMSEIALAKPKAKEEVRNWLFLNDASVGTSWSSIGKTSYISVDLGYSLTIATFASTGGVRRTFGLDIDVPLYVSAFGSSNGITSGDKISEALGWGVIVPVTLGMEVKNFWLKGLFGYAFNEISEGFEIAKNQESIVKMKMRYHGFAYGLSLGWRYKNILNLGFKAMFGKLQNTLRNVEGSGFENAIEKKDRQYDLMRFGAFASITF